MARININLGTPPSGQDGDPVRTAFEKTNTMFTELYKGYNLTTSGGWGGENPPVMPEGFDANALTGTRLVMFNSGLNLPRNNSDHWFVESIDNGAGYRAQRAASYVNKSVYTRQRHGNGTWTKWLAVLNAGDYGIGVQNDGAYLGVDVDPDNYLTGSHAEWATWLIRGVPGIIRATGFLSVQSGKGGFYSQSIIDKDVGLTLTRVKNADAGWTTWRRNYTSGNVLNNLDDAGSPGLMDLRVIGSWAIRRYWNGMMILQSNANPNTPNVNPNESAFISLDLPVPVADPSRAAVTVRAHPSATWDFFGIIASYMDSATKITFVVRNGGNAQFFGIRLITVIGSWR